MFISQQVREPHPYELFIQQSVICKDLDATWLKKGKRSYFGYKCFMLIDQEEGYIDQVHVTPAHISEVSELKKFIKGRQDKRLYRDKGYVSQN